MDLYTVEDDVWFRQARLRSNDTRCIPCLEKVLRRKLTAADFSPYAIVNDPTSNQWPKSATLRNRLHGWMYQPH